jgi:flavin-dependent dehydrogenase
MPDIGILGAGISGLHLALRLRQRGVSTRPADCCTVLSRPQYVPVGQY